LTGILLAVARISGETAPLLFTSFGNYGYSGSLTSGGMASLPWAIFTYAKQPSNELNNMAWAGALIITVGVLVLNIVSRASHHLITKR
jgi:phosphate transport system permease protein